MVSSDYLGLYARGNIDNVFGTRTSLHGLIGVSFYPPSSGEKLSTLDSLSSSFTDPQEIMDKTMNIIYPKKTEREKAIKYSKNKVHTVDTQEKNILVSSGLSKSTYTIELNKKFDK